MRALLRSRSAARFCLGDVTFHFFEIDAKYSADETREFFERSRSLIQEFSRLQLNQKWGCLRIAVGRNMVIVVIAATNL